MRRLTLVRHGRAVRHDAEVPDFERPLDAHGRQEAVQMAQRLVGELERPLRLVSSPAARALATAQAFAVALGIEDLGLAREPRIYEATPGELLQIVRELDDEDVHVLLFGHNPGFTDLARLLADCRSTDLPTCATVTMAFDIAHWRDIHPGDGTLERLLSPED